MRINYRLQPVWGILYILLINIICSLIYMMHSNLKIGFIILSLFLSVPALAQMGENQAPQPEPVEAVPADQTAAAQNTAPPTQVGTGVDATAATKAETLVAEPVASQTFVQKIFAPIRTLFYRVTDALGITSAATRVSRGDSTLTKSGTNPGRHARVYMRQSGGTGTQSDAGTKTDVMRQTTDTSSSVNLLR
jgi:hypothetical protein